MLIKLHKTKGQRNNNLLQFQSAFSLLSPFLLTISSAPTTLSPFNSIMLKTHVLIFLLSTLAVVFAEGESDGLWSFPIETMHGRRLSESNGQHANPYAGFGMHFVPIYFGNPAQLRTLAVSTSDAYTAMPCEVGHL